MAELDGQVVLVTGASRGIGRAAAFAFADAGASVALLARSRDELEKLADELGRDRALPQPADVASWHEVEEAVTACVERFGRLDVLVNNAGVIAPIAAVHEADPADWRVNLDVNALGVFHGVRAAAAVMVEQRAGTILTVSSGAAHRPKQGWSAYCAAKAAAWMLTRSVDLELREHGVRAIGLSPGTVATRMQREIKQSGVNPVSELDWDEHIPPEWVARALVWLAGPAGDDWRGEEVSLRDDDVRRTLDLVDDE